MKWVTMSRLRIFHKTKEKREATCLHTRKKIITLNQDILLTWLSSGQSTDFTHFPPTNLVSKNGTTQSYAREFSTRLFSYIGTEIKLNIGKEGKIRPTICKKNQTKTKRVKYGSSNRVYMPHSLQGHQESRWEATKQRRMWINLCKVKPINLL